MTTPARFLLTGVTGGLGAKILTEMLNVHHVPPQDIIATSRSEENRDRFEAQGLHFRVLDYTRPETLVTAFADGVKDFLFMSSSQANTEARNQEHRNVAEAARNANVGRIWYVSLAFGGWTSDSPIHFQQAHYWTEKLLQQLLQQQHQAPPGAGGDFVSIRAGIYSDAFPIFLNWYPSTKTVLLPRLTPTEAEGKIAFTTRAELGEGIATLLVKGLDAFPQIVPRTDRRILLLTGPETYSHVDMVGAINRSRAANGGAPTTIRYLDPEEWVAAEAKDDLGGKGKAWFESRLIYHKGVLNGDAETVDSALEILLGRKPETGVQAVERFLRENAEYKWHQNHVNGKNW